MSNQEESTECFSFLSIGFGDFGDLFFHRPWVSPHWLNQKESSQAEQTDSVGATGFASDELGRVEKNWNLQIFHNAKEFREFQNMNERDAEESHKIPSVTIEFLWLLALKVKCDVNTLKAKKQGFEKRRFPTYKQQGSGKNEKKNHSDIKN